MPFLVGFIHVIFVGIFFLFHRYIEMSIVLGIGLIFLSRIISPLRIEFRRPKIFQHKISESAIFEHSLYISSGILFYTALIGVALGVANVFGLPVDFRLLNYCIFFLTSVIFGIYLLTYPKNPNTFILLRIHCMIASSVLNILTILDIFSLLSTIDGLMMINLFLLISGLIVVVILDRNIPRSVHIAVMYFFVFSLACLTVGVASFFFVTPAILVLCILFILGGFYIFFPPLLQASFQTHHIPVISWHFRNSILAVSWAIFGYTFWGLFWGPQTVSLIAICTLIVLSGLWLFVYATDQNNPLFFAGIIAVAGALVGYSVFLVLPPLFWIVTSILFVFAGSLMLCSRFFKNRPEELILAGGAVVFLCGSDLVLIFQNNSLFALSMLFLFQSLIWYGAYEIFHRQADAKNAAL